MSEPSKPNQGSEKPAAPVAVAPTANQKNNTKTILIVVGVLVVIFVIIPTILVSVGAGIIGHKVINGVKVSNNGTTTTIQTKNGDQITAGTSQSLPKDFPTSVPVYKGTITSSSHLTIDGKATWSVIVETKDDPSKVSDALSQSFSSNGWTASLDNKTTDGGLIAAENGQLHTQVLYSTKDGKTTISYTVVPVTTTSN